MLELKFCKLTENAVIPRKSRPTDTGYDVWTNVTETVFIPPCSSKLFKTGIATVLPTGYALEVASRSSFGSKGIDHLAGEIDNEYHGDIGIILSNINSQKAVVISSQPKEEVEKCEYYNVIERRFQEEEPTEKQMNEYSVIPKYVVIVKYLCDAIAQLKLIEVPVATTVEITKEELEEAMKLSSRKDNGYGSTDKKS